MRIIVVFLFVTGAILEKNGVEGSKKKDEIEEENADVPFIGCYNTKFPYMCSNGQCAESYYDCREKALQCENLKYFNQRDEMLRW